MTKKNICPVCLQALGLCWPNGERYPMRVLQSISGADLSFPRVSGVVAAQNVVKSNNCDWCAKFEEHPPVRPVTEPR